jgi:hypothetical protein
MELTLALFSNYFVYIYGWWVNSIKEDLLVDP